MRRIDSVAIDVAFACSGVMTILATRVELPSSPVSESTVSLYSKAKDPKIGSLLLDMKPFSPLAAKGKRIMVVAMGGCGSCSIRKFDPKVLTLAPDHPTVAVFEGTPVKETKDLKGFSAKMYLDSVRYRMLNAVWSFRLYATDSKGRVADMQLKGEKQEAFAERAFH